MNGFLLLQKTRDRFWYCDQSQTLVDISPLMAFIERIGRDAGGGPLGTGTTFNTFVWAWGAMGGGMSLASSLSLPRSSNRNCCDGLLLIDACIKCGNIVTIIVINLLRIFIDMFDR